MKKNLLVVGIVIAVIIVGILVWYFGFRPGPGLRGPGLLGPNIGPMTDELYIEIALEIASQGEKDPTWQATPENMAKLLKNFGVTMEQYDAYSAQILADPDRHSRITQEITNRLMEKALKEIKLEQ